MLNRNIYIFAFPLILLHLALFAYQLYQQNWYLVDSYEYLHAADNMAKDGSWYSKDRTEAYDPGQHTRRTPLYPFLLMLGNFLTHSPILVAIWQMALSLVNIYLIYLLLQKLKVKKTTFYFLLFFLLLLPAQYIYANLIMTEILFQSLLTLGFWLGIKAWEEGKTKQFWFLSLILILAMLTKPVMYLFFLPYLAFLSYLAFKQKKYLLFLPALLPLLFVLAYQGINYKRTGYFHYSSVQSLNLLQLTAYNLLINRVGEEEAVKRTDDIFERAMAAPDFAAGQKLMQEECLEIMWEYKGFYLQYHIKGMVNFFLDPGRFDLYHTLGIQEVGEGAGLSRAFSEGGYEGIWNYLRQQPLGILGFLVLVFVGNVFRLMGFLGFLFLKKIPIGWRFGLFVLIGYLAFVTGPYGASRFSLPVNLLLIMAAVVFWAEKLPSSPKKSPIK